jgi:hypothetical protein
LPIGSSVSSNTGSSPWIRDSTRYAGSVPVFLTVVVTVTMSPALTWPDGDAATETSRLGLPAAVGAVVQSTPIVWSAATSFFSSSARTAWTILPAPAISRGRVGADTLDTSCLANRISKSSTTSSSSVASSSSGGRTSGGAPAAGFLRSTM